MTFRVGIGTFADRVAGSVFDLPGCDVGAASSEELHALLSLSIAEHTLWRARHGEPVPSDGTPGLEIVEVIDAATSGAADGEFCFAGDLVPVTPDELERAVRHMGFARDDLRAITRDLPGTLLDWRPPASAMSRIDEWRPEVRTIREILQDIASAEFYYRTGLTDAPPPDPDALLFDLDVQRERLVAALYAVPAAHRGRVFRPKRPWQNSPEHWTMRKVLRRVIGHERFHTKEIEQRLAWLLVGVPSFR